MKGDFSRDSYDRAHGYTRVLKQQGRVDLDADWNEQSRILDELDRTTRADVLGPVAAPIANSGFRIGLLPTTGPLTDLALSPGRLYVDGILCELPTGQSYLRQPFLPNPPSLNPPPAGTTRTDLVYLDVHERHVTTLEDPGLREVALGGPDTCTRVQTVFRIRISPGIAATSCATATFPDPASTGGLRTFVAPGSSTPSLCEITAGGGYRGLENRFYRVEIHTPGNAGAGASFKWSRDNGAIVFAVTEVNAAVPQRIRLRRLGRDQFLTLRVGDWIEILGDTTELNGGNGLLRRVTEIDEATLEITLDQPVDSLAAEPHLRVRRWDQSGPSVNSTGSCPITAGLPVELEDGVTVEFGSGFYRAGDYWCFAARAITRDVEPLGRAAVPATPGSPATPAAYAPAQGVTHHYARLGLIHWNGPTATLTDCRPEATTLTTPRLFYVGGDGQVVTPTTADGEAELPLPLAVGLPVQQCHPDRVVRFEVLNPPGGSGPVGRLASTDASLSIATATDGSTVDVRADAQGRFQARFFLRTEWNPTTRAWNSPIQHVRARLLDPGSAPEILPPLQFNARLAVAEYLACGPDTLCHGLKGTYYQGLTFDRRVFTRIDRRVDFEWHTGSPGRGVAPDQFSVIWTGRLRARGSGQYRFTSLTDDGVSLRLRIGGAWQTVFESWTFQAPTDFSGTADLAAGQDYDLELRYNENGGGAVVRLSWEGPDPAVPGGTFPREIIGTEYLRVDSLTAQETLEHIAHEMTLVKLTGDDFVTEFDRMTTPTTRRVKVQVVDHCGPVPNIRVIATPDGGDAITQVTPGSAELTDADGCLELDWDLDRRAGNHELVLTAVPNGLDAPPALRAVFRAEVLPSRLEPGIHIKKLTLLRTKKALLLDSTLPAGALADGIRIECDGELDAILSDPPDRQRPICEVTIDIPYPPGGFDTAIPFAFHRLVLAARVKMKSNTLDWSLFIGMKSNDSARRRLWEEITAAWFDLLPNPVDGEVPPKRLLVRLTLNGNFVWSPKDPNLFLDADVVGRPTDKSPPLALDLTREGRGNGDGRFGGHFEMWFWLEPDKTDEPEVKIVTAPGGKFNLRAAVDLAEVPLLGPASPSGAGFLVHLGFAPASPAGPVTPLDWISNPVALRTLDPGLHGFELPGAHVQPGRTFRAQLRIWPATAPTYESANPSNRWESEEFRIVIP